MKQTEKTEKKKHLTDAELRQVTGGDTVVGSWEECPEESDKASCVQKRSCVWVDGKDSHCTVRHSL